MPALIFIRLGHHRRVHCPMPSERIRVAPAADFKKKNPIKFPLSPRKEGFVISWKNEFFGYENVCCHVALPLDYGDGGFFSPDGNFLLCRNHGAEYEPSTGLCVRGPCQGAGLERIAVSVENGVVWVNINTGEKDANE
jgi:nitrite reductase/ring-hydroxylating ferredoxin subunit